MEYTEFLKSKSIEFKPVGFEIDEALVPQNGKQMFKFQHDVVRWALRLGKAAIFADCGLGKTMMQLQWAWQVANNPRGGRFGRFPACRCRADNSRGQEVRN